MDFKEEVNKVASAMTQDKEGTWVIPEGVEASDEVRFAAGLEKRRRDTQSAYAKSQEQLKQTKVERDKYAQGWESDFSRNLSSTQQAELEELKASDPDAWRAKLNEYEQTQRTQFEEKKTEIKQHAKKESEMEARTRQLSEWQAANPKIELTDDVIANDIPPRITKQLEKGDINFETFLAKCGEYLSKGRATSQGGDKAPNHGNLSSAAGGSAPSGDAVKSAVIDSYSSEIY